MAGIMPDFIQVDSIRRPGNPYADPSYYPYKAVLLMHMTVGMSLSENYVKNHTVPPQDWYDVYTDTGYQTLDLDMGGYALYQPQYGYHWTNKHRYMLQTELVGIPVVNQRTYTDDQCRKIAERVIVPKVKWLRSIGEDIDLSQVTQVFDSSGSASVTWPGRMSEQEMADFNGLMQHITAWGNDHWDCSVENLQLMAYHAKTILTPEPKEDEFDMKHFYDTDGTLWVVEGLNATPMGALAGGVHRDVLKDIGSRMLDTSGGPLVIGSAQVPQLFRVQTIMP